MNLIKNLVLVSNITLISKVIGFIKDIVIAKIFGAGLNTDSFFISFRLINLFKRILADGIFFQVLIPILVDYKNNNSIKDTKIFIKKISGFLIILLFIIMSLCLLFSSNMIKIIAPGVSNNYNEFLLTVNLFKILLPYIFIISFISFSGSVLNIFNNFTVSSISPSISNLVTGIFLILIINLYNSTNIILLPISIIVGNILQLIIHLFSLKFLFNINLIPNFSIDKNIFNIIYKIIPITINVLVSQISNILNTILVSFLNPGSISWLYYSDKIIEFSSGVLGVSLSTIIFPILSNNINNIDKYSDILNWGIRLSLLLSIPASIIIIILSEEIIVSLFQYGKFSKFDTLMTKESLIYYSLGLTSIVILKLLNVAFSSYQDNKTVLKSSVLTLFLTQFINFLLIFKFKHIGLSLSITLTSLINSIILYYMLIKNKLFKDKIDWLNILYKIFISSLVMIISLKIGKKYIKIFDYNNLFIRLIKLVSLILIGKLSYLVSFFLLKKF
ncbi:putative lipid II flippase MurJ [endosymbiont of Sipalinus gigas]|uniref:murein biosynthesis integral membrane protein MurJ n=1 Tax=endosymbiont of Sipalinus gigas TaxID=1972134 RepID=UPI000DC6FD82|nr:murein biosynthesis integral membrane protein MurJ [endosymbiont of Sipalinus gigas]BBA85363.1 putative lipid II flippase MurJ [endosymbiont of Sipalinus gigas]